MKIKSYYDLNSDEKEKFVIFLKNESKDKKHKSYENMDPTNFENKPHTLLYLLEKTNQFQTIGIFNILFDNDFVIGCSGAYQSEFSNEFVFCGTRSWIKKEYRNKSLSRDFLLVKEKEWALQNNFKAIGVCFNEYNKNLIQLWKRSTFGLSRIDRTPKHLFYKNMEEIPYPLKIKNTKQWVVYEKLEENWTFDWKKLKFIDEDNENEELV